MDAISFVLGEKTSNLRVKRLSVRIISLLLESTLSMFFCNKNLFMFVLTASISALIVYTVGQEGRTASEQHCLFGHLT